MSAQLPVHLPAYPACRPASRPASSVQGLHQEKSTAEVKLLAGRQKQAGRQAEAGSQLPQPTQVCTESVLRLQGSLTNSCM
jgi:hypothetical protein